MLAKARSYSLGLLLQSAPICCAIGSGKMSSSPRATPASTALATSAGLVFGIGRSLTMSVSIGPGNAARISMRFPLSSGRSACVIEYEAAFDAE